PSPAPAPLPRSRVRRAFPPSPAPRPPPGFRVVARRCCGGAGVALCRGGNEVALCGGWGSTRSGCTGAGGLHLAVDGRLRRSLVVVADRRGAFRADPYQQPRRAVVGV